MSFKAVSSGEKPLDVRHVESKLGEKKVKILDLKMKVWKSHMLEVTLFHKIYEICIFCHS